jgi:predicted transcriptional regulator
MRTLKIGSNQALWHLSCLEKFCFVRSTKLNNHRIFFPYDSDPKFDKLHYYLNKELVQTIINFMKEENKAFKITEIADGLKKNHSTIKKYLDTLIKLKLIRIEKLNGRNGFKFDLERYSKVLKSVRGE